MNIVFPAVCVACQRRIGHGVVCDACFGSITVRDSFLCGKCHARLDRGGNGGNSPKSFCHPDFPYVLGAATGYADKTVQTLVHHLKFRSIKGAAEPLAELMLRYLTEVDFRTADPNSNTGIPSFIVMPVPLSSRRLRTRGYNQAELIARRVAASLELPVVADALIRAKHTKPQSDTVSATERRENIRGAYAIRDSAVARAAVDSANILLIDDVSTSGATFLEASRVLKAAGAQKIIAVAVAKT